MTTLTVYQDRLKAVRTHTAAQVAAQFAALPDLDRSRREAFAATASRTVAAGQITAARVTAAYVSRTSGLPVVRLTPAQVTGTAARRGIDPLEEYQRPFGAAWAALGEDLGIDEAKARGVTKAQVLALADVWLASRAATEAIQQSTGRIAGWVRRADATACDLCAAADGLAASDAADFAGHPGCGCTNEPTMTDVTSDPVAPDVFDVHEHDELGPLLYQAGQHFAAA